MLQLEFVRHLLTIDQPQALGDAARFLDAHLLRWIHLFSDRVGRAHPYYQGVARLTGAYLEELRDHLTEITGVVRSEPSKEPEEEGDTATHQDEDRPYIPGTGPSW